MVNYVKNTKKYYLHQIAVQDIIIEIKKEIKEVYDIMISIDGNTYFTNATRDIAKLCRDYELFDLFDRIHEYNNNT